MADVVEMRQATAADIDVLFDNLRPADAAEVAAYGIGDGREATHGALRRSLVSWAAYVDNELAAVLGLAPVSLLGGVGAPWMLGTPVLERHARVLVSTTPQYIHQMLRVTPILSNFVHAENKASIRWLRRVGFLVFPAVPYGARGELFHPFEMRA